MTCILVGFLLFLCLALLCLVFFNFALFCRVRGVVSDPEAFLDQVTLESLYCGEPFTSAYIC